MTTYRKLLKKNNPDITSKICDKIVDAGFLRNISFTQDVLETAMSGNEFYNFLDNFFTQACSLTSMVSLKDVPPLNRAILSSLASDQKTSAFLSTLDQAFNRPDPQPLVINFCHNVMLNGSDSDPFNRGVCENHSSMIIGERGTSRASCEVLIRETEGPDCNPTYKWPCENGQYWVPVNTLSQKTSGLFYFP